MRTDPGTRLYRAHRQYLVREEAQPQAEGKQHWVTMSGAHVLIGGDGKAVGSGPAATAYNAGGGASGTHAGSGAAHQGGESTQGEDTGGHAYGSEGHRAHVTAAFASYLHHHKNEAIAAFKAKHGNFISTDEVRELSPHYAASKTSRSYLSSAVQASSSGLAAEMYDRALHEPVPAGKEPTVVMAAGGAGAGKTTGLSGTPATQAILEKAHIHLDTVLSDPHTSVGMVQQALAAGHQVHIVYVHRDPHEAFLHGVLPRAEATGRALALRHHIAGHLGAARTIRHLAQHFANHPDVSIHVVDNSRGKGQQQVVPIEQLPQQMYTKEGLHARLAAALEEAHHAGTISERVYKNSNY